MISMGIQTINRYPCDVVSNDLINSYEENDLRKSRYLIWERISSGSETPQYRVPVSKYEVGTYYGCAYGWEAGSWGVAFKVTDFT